MKRTIEPSPYEIAERIRSAVRSWIPGVSRVNGGSMKWARRYVTGYAECQTCKGPLPPTPKGVVRRFCSPVCRRRRHNKAAA